MVEGEGMSPDDWAQAWWKMPRGILSPRAAAHLDDARQTVVEVGDWRVIEVAKFASLSRNCPYDGVESNCWPSNE
jgi:hypothetical protein